MKKSQHINKSPIAFISILLIIIMCIACITPSLSTIQSVNAEAEGETETKIGAEPTMAPFKENPEFEKRLPLYQELQSINPHTIGWIYIEGTKVDNVLMQNKENKDFYIDKGFDGKYYYPGTLYISDISDIIEPTDVVIVYGHNMSNRTMFGSLREFLDPEFLKKYDTITVDSLEGRLEYEITNVMRIRVNVEGGDDFPYYTYSNFESEEQFNAFMEQCNSHSLYDSGKSVEFGDRLIMLTTCEYTYDDGTGRTVIMGKNPKPQEEPTEPAITTPEPVIPPEPSFNPINLLIAGGAGLLVILLGILLITLRRRRK